MQSNSPNFQNPHGYSRYQESTALLSVADLNLDRAGKPSSRAGYPLKQSESAVFFQEWDNEGMVIRKSNWLQGADLSKPTNLESSTRYIPRKLAARR